MGRGQGLAGCTYSRGGRREGKKGRCGFALLVGWWVEYISLHFSPFLPLLLPSPSFRSFVRMCVIVLVVGDALTWKMRTTLKRSPTDCSERQSLRGEARICLAFRRTALFVYVGIFGMLFIDFSVVLFLLLSFGVCLCVGGRVGAK